MPTGHFRTPLFYLGIVVFGAGCDACSKKDPLFRSPRESAKLTTPGKTLSIEQSHAIYVTDNGSDTITVIDRESDKTETVSVDLEKDTHEGPHHLAIDGSGKTLWVALSYPPDASKKKRDPHAAHGSGGENGLLAKLTLGNLAVTETREVDENPGDVLVSHDKKRVLVSHFDMKRAMDVAAQGGASPSTMFAHLIVFDANKFEKMGSRPVCVAPHGITLTKDDKTAFIACYGSDELAVVDLSADPFSVSRMPLGASPGVPGVPRYGPYSAVLSPDEKEVVVADLEGQDVRVWNRADKRFVTERTVPLAAKAFMPAYVTEDTVLVPLQTPDGLVRVNLAKTKVEQRVSFTKDVCGLPHAVRIAKDGRAYLVCEGDHTKAGSVLEVDPISLTTKKRWSVGVYPDGMAFGDEP